MDEGKAVDVDSVNQTSKALDTFPGETGCKWLGGGQSGIISSWCLLTSGAPRGSMVLFLCSLRTGQITVFSAPKLRNGF